MNVVCVTYAQQQHALLTYLFTASAVISSAAVFTDVHWLPVLQLHLKGVKQASRVTQPHSGVRVVQGLMGNTPFNTSGPCPVSERLAKQKFSHWGFPVNSNEAEFFFA